MDLVTESAQDLNFFVRSVNEDCRLTSYQLALLSKMVESQEKVAKKTIAIYQSVS